MTNKMNKIQDKKQKRVEQRVNRLMARLTLLNESPPRFGWSDHRRKIWRDERANLIRQLKRQGVEVAG